MCDFVDKYTNSLLNYALLYRDLNNRNELDNGSYCICLILISKCRCTGCGGAKV